MPLAPPITAIQQPAVGIYGLPLDGTPGPMQLLTAAQIRAIADVYSSAEVDDEISNFGASLPFQYQPLDADLTAIAALTTTATGRALLTESLAQTGTGVLVRAISPTFTGTLAAGAITASGNLTLQNSTTAVIATFSKTYTSATNLENLYVGYDATAGRVGYNITTRVGSAGGSNQPLLLGHVNSAGTFAGVTVATSGTITASGGISAAGATFTSNVVVSAGGIVLSANSLYFGSYAVHLRGATDVLEINNGTVGQYRDLLVRKITSSGAITASGQLTHTPPASVTLATNGQFSIEMASDTAGNLVYRGSDGTTRRTALVFV